MSELRLTRGEYWLLENAIEYRVALRFLLEAAGPFSEQFNKPGHGLSRPVLIETLERLYSDGWIFWGIGDNEGRCSHKNLTRSDLNRALDEENREQWSIYGLTEFGGARWEEFARPNWELYFALSQDAGWADSPYGTFSSGSLKQLQRGLKLHSASTQPIDFDEVEYTELQPWQATYWKVLRAGFSAKVRFCGDEIESWQDPHADLSSHRYSLLRQSWYAWG